LLWLVVPILLVNLFFAGQLPPMYARSVFWHDIPAVVAYGENVLRTLVIAVPLLMPLSLRGRRRRVGFAVYLAGLIAYLAAWFALILAPDSAWSTSAVGLLAPAYTPLVWAVGIGLVGQPRYLPAVVRTWAYPAVAVLFTAFHLLHAATVYHRLFP